MSKPGFVEGRLPIVSWVSVGVEMGIVTSHNDPIYGIKHYMFMLYSLDMASGTVLWPQNHCVPSQPLCLILHSVYFDITHNVPIF